MSTETTPAARPALGLRTLDMTYIALLTVLLVVCTWISIPTAVPFTLQTFAVFMALGLLGGKRGTLSVLVYLLLGIVGLPVFSGFRGGVGALLGATGGYLAGFLLTALLYWAITHFLGERLWVSALAMVLGLAVCYAFGTAWFISVYTQSSGPMTLATALGMCVIPFVIPDLCKLGLALLLTRRLKPHLK